MKIKYLKYNIVAILLFISIVSYAQSIDSLFINMPDYINPVVNKPARNELLSLFKMKLNDSTLNKFGKKTEVIKYDSLDFLIAIKNTAVSSFEMKKFRLNDGRELIGVIRSFGDSINSSNITFYNTDWTVNTFKFEIPGANQWLDQDLLKDSSLDIQWAKNQLLTSFISLSFTGIGLKIEAKNNTIKFLSDETRKILKPYLSDKNITYEFVDNQWIKYMNSNTVKSVINNK